uniref:Lethal(2) giant larvae protein (inferred by orthology to a D. melanogaster protein) n=1 Tax=Anisakis simplex TaxID=6269 RepID=A0A0M3J240_ANISI
LAEATALNGALSRFKSMKKSIRQSFRRKKKPAQVKLKTNELNATAASNQTDEDEAGCSYDEVKPVERAIVSRSETLPLNAGDPLQSCVRVLKFYHANIISSTSGTDSLWVGTNSGDYSFFIEGIILVYAIADDAIKPEDVCVLIKEIRLQHRAPIIDLNCVNSDGSSLVKGSSAGAQRLLVCSEEQLKTFSLPLMKAQRFKYKLTATEGSRIRKVELLTLRSLIDRKVYEKFVAVITNQGELLLFAAASLKRLAKANFTKVIEFEVNDVVGISSTVVSQQGELFFLRAGGSEFERASLSAYQQSHFLQQHNF